jgi:DNA-binding NarL/FixJ family response regulator
MMGDTAHSLRNAQVLVAEDDFYLASDLQAALEDEGATVIGPFADEADAGRALTEVQPDCAFVDVNLGQGPSFELARTLSEQAVPFAFVTGYDRSTIPEEFASVVRFEKPVDVRRVVRMLAIMLGDE